MRISFLLVNILIGQVFSARVERAGLEMAARVAILCQVYGPKLSLRFILHAITSDLLIWTH